jgi:hypothetical protein
LGKLILFPGHKRPSVEEWTASAPEKESSEARLARIKASLERINRLMEDIRKEHAKRNLVRVDK